MAEKIQDEEKNVEKTLYEKIKALEADLLEPEQNEEPKNETPVLIFETIGEESPEKKTENAPLVLDAPVINVPPIVEPVKNTKKEKRDVVKKLVEKESFTIATIFPKDEYEQIMKVYEARKEAGLCIDRNNFFRQLIQFAFNANKYKIVQYDTKERFEAPHFGVPENTNIQLKNTL